MKLLIYILLLDGVRFRESVTTTDFIQYILIGAAFVAAVLWLFRKKLFPKKYANSNCGDSDCGCH